MYGEQNERSSTPITRRGFLGAIGAMGGAAALAACGGKSKPGAVVAAA